MLGTTDDGIRLTAGQHGNMNRKLWWRHAEFSQTHDSTTLAKPVDAPATLFAPDADAVAAVDVPPVPKLLVLPIEPDRDLRQIG